MAREKGMDQKEKHGKRRRGILAVMANAGGAMAVEFAIVAPLFLGLALGVVEVGRAFWIKHTIQHAVEQTARYAMVNTSATTAELTAYAQTQLSGISPGGIVFTASQSNDGSMDFMSITASYSFQTIVPLVPLPAVTLNAKSRVPLIP